MISSSVKKCTKLIHHEFFYNRNLGKKHRKNDNILNKYLIKWPFYSLHEFKMLSTLKKVNQILVNLSKDTLCLN